MSIPKTGSRLLRINGSVYRWRVRGRPTYDYGLGKSNWVLAVEDAQCKNGCVLLVQLNIPHPSNWMRWPSRAITPAEVRHWIQHALALGWQPKVSGKPFGVSTAEEIIAPK